MTIDDIEEVGGFNWEVGTPLLRIRFDFGRDLEFRT
jgi:hypothetical protein